jgi:hypothetical protein
LVDGRGLWVEFQILRSEGLPGAPDDIVKMRHGVLKGAIVEGGALEGREGRSLRWRAIGIDRFLVPVLPWTAWPAIAFGPVGRPHRIA